MNILAAIAADPNVSPAFRQALAPVSGPAAGQAARDAYIAQCAAEGREYDPITADDEYRRAKCRAEGRTFYAGD